MLTSITANNNNIDERSDEFDELGFQGSGLDTSMDSDTAGTEDMTTSKTAGNKNAQENLPPTPNSVASKCKRTGKALVP